MTRARGLGERERDRAPGGAGAELDDHRAAAGQRQQLGELGRSDGGDQAEAVAVAARVPARGPEEAGYPPGQHAQREDEPSLPTHRRERLGHGTPASGAGQSPIERPTISFMISFAPP
jgi:hypothetical protein